MRMLPSAANDTPCVRDARCGLGVRRSADPAHGALRRAGTSRDSPSRLSGGAAIALRNNERRRRERTIPTAISIHATTSTMLTTASCRPWNPICRTPIQITTAENVSPARTANVSIAALALYFAARSVARNSVCRTVFSSEYSVLFSATLAARTSANPPTAAITPYAPSAITGITNSVRRIPSFSIARDTTNAWITKLTTLTQKKKSCRSS